MQVKKAFFPKKYLGQHFLINPHVQQKIISACQLKPSDTVLEIGPGRGILTRSIVQQVQRVIAIEKDKELVDYLCQTLTASNIDIIHADILKYPFGRLPEHLKIIGNLPYNIATAIVEKVIRHRAQCDVFYMTVQLEQGLRMTAEPHNKDYGAFSCFVQYYAQVKKLFNIKNTCFNPAPKVQSCFVSLKLLPAPRWKADNEDFLFTLINTCFAQRRKIILNPLAALIGKNQLLEILKGLNLSPKSRAENLTLEDYVRLANTLFEVKKSG